MTYLPAAAALGDRGPATAVSTDHLTVFAPLPDSLPGTAREARSIVRPLPRSRMRLGKSSSEAEVRRSLEAGEPVHLASHGSHNSQNPLFSRVVAGGRSGPGSGSDGLLEVHEILGMRTTTPLVFSRGVRPVLRRRDSSRFRGG